MRLILARHGQSFVNINPAAWEGKDAPLSPLGEQQADRLGQWLQKNEPKIDTIFCSGLMRARQTTEIANRYLNLPVTVNTDLNELERYDLPILPRRHHPFMKDSHYRTPKDDGYYDNYRARVRRAMDQILTDVLREKPILIVSHGGTSATIMRTILERHDLYITTNNAGMHFVNWQDGCWRIEAMNYTRHLPDDMVS